MEHIPKHVALILDGNRRWATGKGKNPITGHRKGAEVVEGLIRHLKSKGVHTVTIWVFSTENWKRQKLQVEGLMKLFEEFLDRYTDKAVHEGTQVIHLGRKDRISSSLLEKIEKIEAVTSDCDGSILNVCLDYGGRDEILRAICRLRKSQDAQSELSDEVFEKYLDTHDQEYPNPDIIVRTGGEKRMSGFMLWQAAYAEYFFVEKYLPDMTEADIDDILIEYEHRHRRFGS